MKSLILFVALLECVLLIKGDDDLFLRNLKHQFSDVPRDVKLFDFLQNENNLKGLIGMHNDMCQQLNYFNNLKANHRARREAETTDASAATVSATASVPAVSDATVADVVSNVTLSESEASGTSAPPTVQRKRRDASDASASTTNTTASSNQTDDKDQQQNLNDQQPPADDQGDQQAPAGENQEAEMQAAGVAYFKQLILNVIRYILNCLMTYINMFY